VPSDRLRKYTEENKELAQNLKKEMDALRHRPAPKATASTKKKNAGSDLSSTRGSEERHSSVPVTGRGQKRGRDFEIEKVGDEFSMRCMSEPLPGSTIGRRTSNEGGSGSSGSSTRPSSPPTPAVNIKRPIFYDGAADSPERPSVAPEETASASDLSTPPASPSAGPGGPEAPNEDAVAASPGGAATVAKRAKKTSATRKTKIQPTSRKTRGRPAGVGPEDVVKVKIEELEAQSPAKRQRGPKGLKTLPQSQPQPQLLNPEPEGDEVTPKTALKTVLNTDPNVACKDPCCKCKCHSAKLSGPKQEDAFMNKLAVKIPIPDNLKNILVDDWEQVTKNQSLVPVPVPCPVNDLLDLYQADEIKNRRVGSAEYDILQETVHGLKEYFANCLGKVLLYKLERIQYYEMRACWEGSIKEWEGKGPGDVYGAEHLIRLWCKSTLSSRCPHSPHSILPLVPNQANPTPSSLHARTHCPNKHGPTIRQPHPRGIHQARHVDFQKREPHLHRRV